MKVTAQINNGDPCPKKEHRAWDWVSKEVKTLSEAIKFLLEEEAYGFTITDDNGNLIAESVATHYS